MWSATTSGSVSHLVLRSQLKLDDTQPLVFSALGLPEHLSWAALGWGSLSHGFFFWCCEGAFSKRLSFLTCNFTFFCGKEWWSKRCEVKDVITGSGLALDLVFSVWSQPSASRSGCRRSQEPLDSLISLLGWSCVFPHRLMLSVTSPAAAFMLRFIKLDNMKPILSLGCRPWRWLGESIWDGEARQGVWRKTPDGTHGSRQMRTRWGEVLRAAWDGGWWLAAANRGDVLFVLCQDDCCTDCNQIANRS